MGSPIPMRDMSPKYGPGGTADGYRRLKTPLSESDASAIVLSAKKEISSMTIQCAGRSSSFSDALNASPVMARLSAPLRGFIPNNLHAVVAVRTGELRRAAAL